MRRRRWGEAEQAERLRLHAQGLAAWKIALEMGWGVNSIYRQHQRAGLTPNSSHPAVSRRNQERWREYRRGGRRPRKTPGELPPPLPLDSVLEDAARYLTRAYRAAGKPPRWTVKNGVWWLDGELLKQADRIDRVMRACNQELRRRGLPPHAGKAAWLP